MIEGAKRAMAEGRIDMIYSEIITQPTYSGQKRFDEALAIYYDAGFELFNIYNLNFDSQGGLRQVDVIFVRRREE